MSKVLNSPKKTWHPSLWTLLALLAVGLLGYCYAVGDAAALPVRLVPHLDPRLLDAGARGRGYAELAGIG